VPNGGKDLIQFLGRTSDQEYRQLLETCKAVLYPPKEDFGIAPIEFISAGVPILAFGQGGALDWCKTEGEFRNGILFYEQTPEGLVEAILEYEKQIEDCHRKNISILDLYKPQNMRESIKIFDEDAHEKAIRELAGF
jgi:glycosyltransferase involved in cell wall biosynthesis